MSDDSITAMKNVDYVAKALRKRDEVGDPTSATKPIRLPSRRRDRRDETGKPITVTYDKTRITKVAHETLKRHRVIAGFARHPQEDTYRILRTMVLKRLAELEGKTLGLVSPTPGDGKTLTSINLAISMAMVPSHTVLLVDLDLRHPKVHQYFALGSEPGLSDYLVGKANIADCLVNPGIDRFVILPAGRRLKYSSEALASFRMTALMDEFKKRYPERLIIFDLPPLLFSDDALVLLPHMDANLLVIHDGKTTVGELQRCLDILQNHAYVGTVLNNSKEANLHPY